MLLEKTKSARNVKIKILGNMKPITSLAKVKKNGR
jgi:hypothetical protein